MSHVNVAVLDRLLHIDLPVIQMPHAPEAFIPLATNGHRLIVAGNGLFKEIKRPWFYARFQLESFKTPFGICAEETQIWKKVPTDLIRQFIKQAHEHAPLETAAWIVWNETTDQMRLLPLVAESATSVLLKYFKPVLEQGEHLVMDVHSHHIMKAEFSSEDDNDDLAKNVVAITAVLGRIDTKPELKARLCLEGRFVLTPLEQILDVKVD